MQKLHCRILTSYLIWMPKGEPNRPHHRTKSPASRHVGLLQLGQSSGAVHGGGEKVMQGDGHIGSSFSAGREAINMGDGEGMERDESRMKIQVL